ncbi:DUF4203 domain-containing protein [Mesoaciditoga lauensis]|uniref:DUF4203 domain-containing protein n=1 Tax=Mesoaciditoga lauensis TaxID=1495039 RepID=UPI000566FBAC|nr:DUF4203 domain-containing protein [Mesoaciditoga lauensis]
MSMNELYHLAVEYWPVALLIGFALAFFGYYLLRTSLAIVGFIAGLYGGQMLWQAMISQHALNISPSNMSMIHMVVVIIIAFLATTLFIAFYKFAIFLAGFLAGGFVVYYFYSWIISTFNIKITIANNPNLVGLSVFLIFGVIVGLVTLMSERKAVGIALAALGALIVAYSAMIPLSGYFKVDPRNIVQSLSDGQHMWMLTIFVSIFLGVSIFAVSFQVGRKKKKKGENG